MDVDKTYTISRSLNGDTVYYIARNKTGGVFARELTMDKLTAAIKAYKAPPINPTTDEITEQIIAEKVPAQVELPAQEQEGLPVAKETPVPVSVVPVEVEPAQATTKPQETVQEKRKSGSKASFWDKLK